jgi:hypothetical protein
MKDLNTQDVCHIGIPFEVKLRLVKEALGRSGKITIPKTVQNMEQCFTIAQKYYFFWYNDESGSTRVVKEKIIK